MTPNPPDAARMELADGEPPDWAAIDEALAQGDLVVEFEPGDRWERLTVERTDEGPHRLVLDGGGGEARAVVEGILTPFHLGARHRVTIRGFEITGSRDKGIYWEAGDDVLIEDVVIHANRGTPALYLEYSNRVGMASTHFAVRNSHVYDQRGECIYIGGAEGTDQDSHRGVVIENNLVHDCFALIDSKHDGINIKDRMSDVEVRRNVVLHTDWGIEAASPGNYEHNLVIDVNREAFQVADAFSTFRDMDFVDNVVVRPGHDGFHFATTLEPATGIRLLRNTVVGADRAALLVASDGGIELAVDELVVVDSAVAFDGWGRDAVFELGPCATRNTPTDHDRLFEGQDRCGRAPALDVTEPAGPDGVFFTADDPGFVEGGARPPVE